MQPGVREMVFVFYRKFAMTYENAKYVKLLHSAVFTLLYTWGEKQKAIYVSQIYIYIIIHMHIYTYVYNFLMVSSNPKRNLTNIHLFSKCICVSIYCNFAVHY